jgi:hypothetical protein
MAGNRFKARTNPIATSTSAKTLLQVIAASNHAVMVDEISISFKGTSNTAAPIRVDICRQSDAGTTTAGGTNSTIKFDPDDVDETIQTTIRDSASAEPTTGDILMTEYVHPQTGYTWQAPHGRSIKIGGGDRLGVRVTADADVNAVVRVNGEE